MNIGLTVSHGRISPCFPGVDLWILEAGKDIEQKQVIDTQNWHVLAWGQELMRRNVNVLLCSGVNRFLWGSLQGYGIEVIPNAVGLTNEVIKQWHNGTLTVPKIWPPQLRGGCRKGFRKRKGRQRNL